MKFIFTLWFVELASLAIAANIIVSCRADVPSPVPQAPAPVRQYPNILDTPRLAESAMEELERIVKDETEQKAQEYAAR